MMWFTQLLHDYGCDFPVFNTDRSPATFPECSRIKGAHLFRDGFLHTFSITLHLSAIHQTTVWTALFTTQLLPSHKLIVQFKISARVIHLFSPLFASNQLFKRKTIIGSINLTPVFLFLVPPSIQRGWTQWGSTIPTPAIILPHYPGHNEESLALVLMFH